MNQGKYREISGNFIQQNLATLHRQDVKFDSNTLDGFITYIHKVISIFVHCNLDLKNQ